MNTFVMHYQDALSTHRYVFCFWFFFPILLILSLLPLPNHVVATPKVFFFLPLLNALLFPEMTSGHCFPTLSAYYSK